MPITAITIDFWNTLFDNANGEERNDERRAALVHEIESAGHDIAHERIHAAYTNIWDFFDEIWLGQQRTPSSHEMIHEMLRDLDAPLDGSAIERLRHNFEHGILRHPPAMFEGVADGLKYLASKAPLAIISDTAFSGGKQLRQLMEQVGIAQYFSAYVFSDESGVAKPHAQAYALALEALGCKDPSTAIHFGDIERTDIRGAKNAGMKAVLYKGDPVGSKYKEDTTAADAVLHHWDEIEAVMDPIW